MRTRTTKTAWLILVTVLLLLVPGCGSDSESETTVGLDNDYQATENTTAAFPDVDNARSAPEPAGFDGESEGVAEATAVVLHAADLGREIIYHAEMTVAVTNVAEATSEAMTTIDSLGGLLYGQRTTGGADAASVLTFKVLPADFHEALTRLGELGEIRTQDISADDVTERIVDLESRITTAETSVERLQALLASAVDMTDIATLESQLLDRETTLETLRGQLRTVRDQVDLATIVLTLTEALSSPDVTLAMSAYPGHDGGASCPETGPLSVEEGEDVTVCFEITNTGDTPLTNLEVTDSVLDLELGDLVVVFGDPHATLEPGQDTVLAAEIVVERDLRTRTKVSATPVDQEGQPVEARTAVTTQTFSINATDPGGLPGFRDGLSASWNMLKGIGGVFVLLAGWLVPLLWVLVLGGLYLLWQQRRLREKTTEPEATPEPAEEPEPSPQSD